MGLFEAEVRGYTGEENILTSRVFGTLEILDRTKFLLPILKQCGVSLEQDTDPKNILFSYWKTMGKRTPDVILEDKSSLIFIESKLGSALDVHQLTEEYEDGMKVSKDFWLIAITRDWAEPLQIKEAKNAVTKRYKDPHVQWINWQQIYTILRGNTKNGNQTEGKLIDDLLSLLKAKGLSAFSQFDKAQLNSVNKLWPEMIKVLEECAAFFGTLSSHLHQKNIACIEKGYTRELVQTGSSVMGLQASTRWLSPSITMRAWDNDWKEKEDTQGFLIFFRLSPLELEVGYRLGFWGSNKLRPMFAEAAQSCALAEKLHTLGNCSVSYYCQDYEVPEARVTRDSLNEEAFSLEALRKAKFVMIGRAFTPDEMASPNLLDEVEECLVHMRNMISENGLYFTKQTIDSFIPHEIMETTEDNGDKSPD